MYTHREHGELLTLHDYEQQNLQVYVTLHEICQLVQT